MDQQISFFNWSLKKLLLTVTDTAEKFRIKVVFNIILLTIVKVCLLIPFAYLDSQYFQVYRGFVLLFASLVMMKILLATPRYTRMISHILIWFAIVIVWSNLFLGAHSVNLITLQMVFMIIVCSFYLHSMRSGIIYSFIGCLTVIVFVSIYGKAPAESFGASEELASPAYGGGIQTIALQ